MQTRLQQLSRKLAQWLEKAGLFLLKQTERGLVLLRKGWDWYQSINWPEIPLSPLQWILLFYAIFGIAYLWATPIFEASDERWHFGMIEYISETGELPVQNPAPEAPLTIYRQEGSQPPLYYLLGALVVSPFDLSDAEQYRIENPHAQAGIPDSWGNKNMFVHPVDGVPLEGTPLAVYVLRLLGLGMGAVTIWAVYHCGLLLSPQRPVVGVVAAGLTAFNPMFVFVSASVNNDNLVIMLNSLVILLALQMLRDGFNTRRSLLIAVLIALATLSKLSALVLVLVVALAALWLANRDKDWRGLVILGASMLLVWAAIAGWWYVRNLQLYGELFGTATMAAVANRGVERVFEPTTLLVEFQGFRLSFWGVFGAFNILTTPLLYALLDFLVFLSIFGVMFLTAQLIAIRDFSYARRELTATLFLLSIVLVGGIALIAWTSQTPASQGRLMFPYMAAISPLLAVGFVEVIWWMLFLLSPPDRSFVRAGDAVPEPLLQRTMRWPVRILALFAFLIPFASIAPQYAAPAPLDGLPEDVVRVYARYDNIELIAYDHIDRRYFPGDRVRLTFYWRVQEQTEEDLSLGLALVNPDGVPLGSIDTYPGAGTLRTSTWEPGAIYEDTYEIQIIRASNARYTIQVEVNWYNDEPSQRVEIVDDEDRNVENVLLDVGALVSSSVFEPADNMVQLNTLDDELDRHVSQREFGARLRATAFAVSDDLLLEVQWEVIGTLDVDYTAFAHVLNEDGELVGQADVFPDLPTHYWRFAERYITFHPITLVEEPLPEGEYRIMVGWYENDGETFPRLTIPPASDEDQPQDSLELLRFTVDEDGQVILPELDYGPEVTEDPLAEQIPTFPTPTGLQLESDSEPTDTPDAEVTDEADGS